ncbi:MAG: DUF86 domain-containing protein [Bacteroidia bacterium]
MGEAAKSVPTFVKEKYKDVPWNEMYSLRNKISHEYFGVDYEITLDVATNYLPTNKNQITQILNELGE